MENYRTGLPEYTFSCEIFDSTDQCKSSSPRGWVSMANGLQHGEARLQSEDDLPFYEAH